MGFTTLLLVVKFSNDRHSEEDMEGKEGKARRWRFGEASVASMWCEPFKYSTSQASVSFGRCLRSKSAGSTRLRNFFRYRILPLQNTHEHIPSTHINWVRYKLGFDRIFRPEIIRVTSKKIAKEILKKISDFRFCLSAGNQVLLHFISDCFRWTFLIEPEVLSQWFCLSLLIFIVALFTIFHRCKISLLRYVHLVPTQVRRHWRGVRNSLNSKLSSFKNFYNHWYLLLTYLFRIY